MNEQMISKVVEEVLKNTISTHEQKGHECTCQKHKMNLKIATSLIEKVEQKAAEIGVNVVIAVSDQAGRIVAVHSMDDAYMASYDIAVNKTFTAAGFKMSTAELAKLAQPGGDLYGIQHTNQGKIVIFGGGEPLYMEDRIIGAIGVSGGTAKQDIELAAYGKEVLREVIRGC